jgi:hypothetical protein
MDEHEEFRELCAISVSGELTPDETTRLAEHLRTCSWCEQALHQYRATVLSVVPQLAAEGIPPEGVAASSREAKAAQTVHFETLRTEKHDQWSPRPSRLESAVTGPAGYVPPPARWKEFGMLYAAGILLFLALAVASYRHGIERGVRTAGGSPTNNIGTSRRSPDNDSDRLAAELAERDKTISGLKQLMASKRSRGGEARTLPVAGGSPGKDETLTGNQRSISPTARIAEGEKQLAESQSLGSDEVSRSAVLEAKVGELAGQLRDREEALSRQRRSLAAADQLIRERDRTIAGQQDLLAHDRDIRELMGSRNLYIAEVYDVAETGQTNKPFGRIFYTKGKSLIFYAYDLDQQAAVKTASIFQVWGSEGANQGRAVSLGVFFEDSAANKRWVLTAENAQSLEQIDAVFVTIEPKGGSLKPSGKPLLFASLKNGPNHP